MIIHLVTRNGRLVCGGGTATTLAAGSGCWARESLVANVPLHVIMPHDDPRSCQACIKAARKKQRGDDWQPVLISGDAKS